MGVGELAPRRWVGGLWKKGCQEPVTGAWTQPGPLPRVRFRGVKDRPTRRQVWGGESGVPDGGGGVWMTCSPSGPTHGGTRAGRGRERADMISSAFPSIVLRPDGSSSCFPSRRWGKSRVGAERRSGDPGVRTLAPDSLRNPFRDPGRERLPPQARYGRGHRPVGSAGGWRRARNARLLPRGGGRALASPRWSVCTRLGVRGGGGGVGGSTLTGAQDQFRLNGGNLRPRPLCAGLFCPSVS